MSRSQPVTTYEQTGNLLTASVWNNGPKALNDFLTNKPTFLGQQTIGTAVNNNTWVAIAMDQSNIDTDGGHNTGVNNTRYTCQVEGIYWVIGIVAWNTGAPSGVYRIDSTVAKNSSTVGGSAQFLSIQTQQPSAAYCSTLLQMFPGDYVEIWGRQETGNNWNFDQGSQTDGTTRTCYCMMNVTWVRG